MMIHDLANQRWIEAGGSDSILDMIAVDDRVYTVSLNVGTGSLVFAELDLVSASSRTLASFPSKGRPLRVGLASTGEELFAAVTTSHMTYIAKLEDPAQWRLIAQLKPSHFAPSVTIATDRIPTLLTWTGDSLLSFSPQGLSFLDPVSSALKVLPHQRTLRSYCGDHAVMVWAESGILAWGGQTCSPPNVNVTDQGVHIVMA